MSIVSKGNNLSSELTQPGVSLASDGFGLVTASASYKCDWSASVVTTPRGTPLDFGGLRYLKAHKSSISYDNLQYKTVKVDYVGLDPEINGGIRSNPNTSVANGLTAESITSHPNFFEAATGYGGEALAGKPADFGGAYDDTVLGPVVNRYNPSTKQTVPVPSCEGNMGACFEQPTGGRFIGFVDPDFPSLYGKTQYLARTTTMSGIMYTTSQSDVQALYGLLGTATSTNSWGIFNLIPSWAPVGSDPVYGYNLNLLSQINVEEYGLLYKVMYEIRYSDVGWCRMVYVNI